MNCISWNFHPEFQQGRQPALKALIQKIKVWQNSKQPESYNSEFCTMWSAYQREILFFCLFWFWCHSIKHLIGRHSISSKLILKQWTLVGQKQLDWGKLDECQMEGKIFKKGLCKLCPGVKRTVSEQKTDLEMVSGGRNRACIGQGSLPTEQPWARYASIWEKEVGLGLFLVCSSGTRVAWAEGGGLCGAAEWWLDPKSCQPALLGERHDNVLVAYRQFMRLNWR